MSADSPNHTAQAKPRAAYSVPATLHLQTFRASGAIVCFDPPDPLYLEAEPSF
jgi:hypothetical protein